MVGSNTHLTTIMDKPSQLVIKAGTAARHIREIAVGVNDLEAELISELLDCILKFPIVAKTDGDVAERTEEERD